MHLTGKPDIERQRVAEVVTEAYVELTTHCNLACRNCPRHAVEGFRLSHMSMKTASLVTESLCARTPLKRIVLLGYGEALCNPHFRAIAVRFQSTGAALTLVTNGHLVSGDMADFIAGLPFHEVWFSWDDPENPETGKIRRGSDPRLFWKNVEGFMEARNRHGGAIPVPGMEIVASRSNVHFLGEIIRSASQAGIARFIVTNLFPYNDAAANEVLYARGAPEINLTKLLKKERGMYDITIAAQRLDARRRCPFIERGAVFISTRGDVSPCMELAHPHSAVYAGYSRTHAPLILGTIGQASLTGIWTAPGYLRFRDDFHYFDFPDCSTCSDPSMCYTRTREHSDCLGNPTPCGECLWAKGIIICP
jgi:Fe-coproporphyrin III synthase